MNRLDNKAAMITSAASGIGAQTARLFAEAGAEVVVDINERDGGALARDIVTKGGRAHFYTLDVSREDHWRSVMVTVAAAVGTPDVLVNGAAIACAKLIDDLTLEDWHRVSRVNLDGVLLFSKSAALECGALGNGVRINTVPPGVIDTPMLTATLFDWTAVGYGETDEETMEALLAKHPIGRIGQAIDVAKGILFLASDDSSFMTGSELVIDGSFTA